jgi:hypothetical protein
VLLLREVDRRLGLIARVAPLIPDSRDQRYITHTMAEMLTSRVFGIAAGYEDANDHQQLRHDPAFLVAAGREPIESKADFTIPLASPSTISRLENTVDAKTCFRIHEAMVDIFLDSFATPPSEIILDYDATDDPTHGEQEKCHFNGFYDGYCYLPLYVFCGDQLLVSYLRPSSVGAAHHAPGVTKLLVQKIRSRWPNVRIILRGDSGFAIERLMRWCDKHDVQYVFGYAKNDVLNRQIEATMQEAKSAYEQTKTKQACFQWFRYQASRWKNHRWMIGKAEYGDQGSNPRFVVTNVPQIEGLVDPTYGRPRVDGKQVRTVVDPGTVCSVAINPRTFYETWYCLRGEMENRIKEQQLFLFADRTSCSRFLANQFRLLLSSLSYILVDGIRRLALSGTEQARWRVDTIRLRLFKIAGRVRQSCRRVVFHLASGCPWASIFEAVVSRLCLSG